MESAVEGGVVKETTTTVDSGAFSDSGEVHRVVAQVAWDDKRRGFNKGNIIRALTAIDGRTQSGTTHIDVSLPPLPWM